MINGYKEWLQTALGDKYLVVEEEKTDFVEDKNIAVLKEFSGVNFRTCIMFTYQLQVLTNNVEETMKDLQEKTWLLNDIKIQTNEFPFVKHLMSQPINNSNYLQMDTRYVGTISITITLMASLDLTDLKSIKIDNELIDPTTTTITYQTVKSTNRKNNEELSETNINESSLTLQITIPINNSDFYKKCRNIMFGKLKKNIVFNCELEFFDDEEKYNLDFKLDSKSFQYDRGSLTSATITLVK